jgi:rod shape determining protein RodA
MVLGIMPVVGVPFPLLSYGGSSLLVVCLGVGLVINVHIRRFVY